MKRCGCTNSAPRRWRILEKHARYWGENHPLWMNIHLAFCLTTNQPLYVNIASGIIQYRNLDKPSLWLVGFSSVCHV